MLGDPSCKSRLQRLRKDEESMGQSSDIEATVVCRNEKFPRQEMNLCIVPEWPLARSDEGQLQGMGQNRDRVRECATCVYF